MKKRIRAALFFVMLSVLCVLPMTVNAKAPEIMRSLKSDIQTYGPIQKQYRYGSDIYTVKISYQKKKQRFLFQCTLTSGRSSSSVKMYMPFVKKKAYYTVSFNQTIRASGLTAKISGEAKLKRKTYSDRTSTLRFSRKNKTSAARKIKGSTYQIAANNMLRTAFQLWEMSLETKTTLCFRNFGFSKITVFDGRAGKYAKEW